MLGNLAALISGNGVIDLFAIALPEKPAQRQKKFQIGIIWQAATACRDALRASVVTAAFSNGRTFALSKWSAVQKSECTPAPAAVAPTTKTAISNLLVLCVLADLRSGHC